MQRLVQSTAGRVLAGLAVLAMMGAFVAVTRPARAQDNQTVTVTLNELNSSGVSGQATLTATNDGKTQVSIEVSGSGVTGDHPAHIHEGTCDTLNPNPKYPLANVDSDGFSDTVVDVKLADLLAGKYAINIHKSAAEIGTYIACGNIVASAGGANAAATAPAEATAGATAPAAATAAAGGETAPVTVTLDELNSSGVSGSATLTAEGAKTKVSIEVSGEGVVGDHPVHIHKGTCDNLDPNPAFPLTNIDKNGKSETTVNISLADLQSGGYAINAHKSAAEIGVYVACGNIPNAEGGTAAPSLAATPGGTGGATTQAPATGTGTAADRGGHDMLLLILGAIAVVLVAAFVAVRRREVRA